MHVPVLPDSAPFTSEQRAWLNGFLAGMFSRGTVDPAAADAAAPPVATLSPLTILFGSQTGTAESLAKRAAKAAGQQGFAATVRDMSGVTLDALAQEQAVLVITSTYGEGEPPDNAKALHAALAKAAAAEATPPGRLAAMRYSVCGLGDTNYVRFCQSAKDFDLWLGKLGATRAAPLTECDLEYEASFAAWLETALQRVGGSDGAAAPSSRPEPTRRDGGVASPVTAGAVPAMAAQPGAGFGDPGCSGNTLPATASPFSRANPFPALVVASRNLSGAGSAKQVHHVEFDLADSGLVYEPGDALGVCAQQCPELVDEVLAALHCDGEEAVPAPDGSSLPLRRALAEFCDLGKPTPELLALVGAAAREDSSAGGGAHAATGRAGFTSATASAPHHVIDALLLARGARIDPAAFTRALKRLQPRLYSISSSPAAHAGSVHATVGAVRYEVDGRRRKGVCSTFLADRVQPGESRVGVFVHRNPAFRLPRDPGTPIIMVGPGTGVAPFRGFLHERRATGARGRNWLLFGDQRSACDFLYREELEDWLRAGLLARLDTAFSRDQPEKIYVQHRMLEHAGELYAWLESGAHFYVCGDAARMAKDVDAALRTVVERAGGRSPDQAAEYVDTLRAQKRYARDVY